MTLTPEYRRSTEAGGYETRYARYLEASHAWMAESLEGHGAPASLLDVGCGTGVWLERLQGIFPEARLEGLDPSLLMLTQARERLDWEAVRLREGIATELPYADSSFESVSCLSALHHVIRPDLALAEFARVLRPGGRLYLLDWAADFWTVRGIGLSLKMRGGAVPSIETLEVVRSAAESAGFSIGSAELRKIDRWWGLYRIVAEKS